MKKIKLKIENISMQDLMLEYCSKEWTFPSKIEKKQEVEIDIVFDGTLMMDMGNASYIGEDGKSRISITSTSKSFSFIENGYLKLVPHNQVIYKDGDTISINVGDLVI